MLKFLQPLAEGYYLEDGKDKLTTEKIQAVYPYCNGDGNLNIYGTAMNEEQMNGGANTRPRWIWYFKNPTGYTNDPYHVTIYSRSTIKYEGVDHHTYLQTYAVHFNQDVDDNTKHIVTGGCLPTIPVENPTEYMILGTQGNYRLLTTNLIEGERRSVTSFEQYWKTYNMVKLDVLGLSASTNEYSEDESTWVVPIVDDPTTPDVDESSYRTTIEARGWHSYDAYANATRWNGYNNVEGKDGYEKKVVEELEHWYQTFDMGNGSFDIESANIPPVLVLLDRHGWEIMRRPLPTTTYPYGDELDDLQAYDSPMVKEYHFFNNATKASGCHKYTLRDQNSALRDEIKVSGKAYTSTSLATLPPLTASGVKDSYGFIQDFYVTYTVKEEYEKSYDYTFTDNGDGTFTETGVPSKFLVLQNGRFLKKENNNETNNYISKPIHEFNTLDGNVYDLILSPKNASVNDVESGGKLTDGCQWYVMPNLDIDREMGIKWGASETGAEPLTEKATKAAYYDPEKKKIAYMQTTGFDPYNLQIKNAGTNKYLTTHMTSATLVDGVMVGNYSSGTTDITLENAFSLASVNPNVSTGTEGHDHTNITITNQTFMAVSDANGNMQLMPRFDHTLRVNTDKASPYLTTLEAPKNNATTATIDDNNSMGAQTTFLVRPQIFEYLIIDNEGNEALRYKRAGDYYPAITEHFKSPLATDFEFYKTAPTYNSTTKKLTVTDEITGSFAEAGLNGDDVTVYVRYSYDESLDTDGDNILHGKWFTIKLNNLDVQASGTINTSDGTGVSLYTGTKPDESDETPANRLSAKREWHWKFMASPTEISSPYYRPVDPYAVQIFNRKANYSATLDEPSPMSVPIKVNGKDRFTLLTHPDGGYALAVNGLGTYTYSFLNGASMTTSVSATTTAENTDNSAPNHFTIKSNALSPGAQLIVNNDVTHNYTYNVINNAGVLAVNATQTDDEATVHHYAPYLPETAQTPLLNDETDYTYYGNVTGTSEPYSPVRATKLFTLYGLYDDVVYVRYEDYNAETTPYLVPNVKAVDATTSKVCRGSGSNDVALNISGGLPYNIIWENDNMMQSTDNATISDGGSQNLNGNQKYVWYFEGGDPYALKIKHKGGKYVDGDNSMVEGASNAQQFMLLKKTGYDYGILQVTGTTGANAGKKLTGFGGALTADASTDPTKFIIFGLSVHDLIYRLIIANTCANKAAPASDEYVDIPSSDSNPADPNYNSTTKKLRVYGTTQRDLTSVNDGSGDHYTGEKYQLGETLEWGGNHVTYCHDAGTVSIGDKLEVPAVFDRPNCTFDFYIEGIYNEDGTEAVPALNTTYQGLKRDELMPDAELIGKTVVVNIVYQFDKDVATNTGMGFVTSLDQNLWYTLETLAAETPYLARYTKTQGLQAVAGRETRYTNDYLFTPVGDVYGFKMYNRYFLKNSNTTGDDNTKMMTTASMAADEAVVIDTPVNEYEIYELMAGVTPGYFRIHPVANNGVTKYYVNKVGTDMKLGTTPSEWTFGLDLAMLQPYYISAGNVGGLTTTPKAGQTKSGKTLYEEALAKDPVLVTDLQDVVYNDVNIVDFADGYYRMHSQPGISGISPVRYASGYLHKLEGDVNGDGDESDAIPLHFYSKVGVTGTFDGDIYPLSSGFTVSNATRGDIPVPATEDDPATIFRVVGGDAITNRTISNVTFSTQGLNVIGNKMGTGDATTYRLIDIGGGVVVLVEPVSGNYFNFTQTGNIYDLKYSVVDPERLDDVKWCMEPADNQKLKVTMNDGGDDHYYATFYAPFDVLLPDDDGDKEYAAYICNEWTNTCVFPKKVPAVGDTYDEGKFVPAGTPVIFRITDDSGSMTLSLPSTSPSSSLSSCVFTGQYLEQLLPLDGGVKWDYDVYTFGLSISSAVEKAGDYDTSGDITAPLTTFADTGVGFYINATPNKEREPLESEWYRNNRYVLHNKVYYRATGGSARELDMESPTFIPVIFDYEEEEGKELEPDGSKVEIEGDGCMYDLLGRKVATREQVEDGSWRYRVASGVYIVNGKKIRR